MDEYWILSRELQRLFAVNYLVVKTGRRFVNSPKLPRSSGGPSVSYQSQTARRRSAPITRGMLSEEVAMVDEIVQIISSSNINRPRKTVTRYKEVCEPLSEDDELINV